MYQGYKMELGGQLNQLASLGLFAIAVAYLGFRRWRNGEREELRRVNQIHAQLEDQNKELLECVSDLKELVVAQAKINEESAAYLRELESALESEDLELAKKSTRKASEPIRGGSTSRILQALDYKVSDHDARPLRAEAVIEVVGDAHLNLEEQRVHVNSNIVLLDEELQAGKRVIGGGLVMPNSTISCNK